jgi:hypothetical protein
MRAECGVRSRTQQITRKHPYKTLDLWRHKSVMAITTPKRAFCVITRKEIARSAKALGTPGVCWHANARRFSKSFGGRLAQIRAIRARNSERRAWSSAEEFDGSGCAHAGPEDKRAPSSRAVFARGERAGGEGLDGLRKSLAEKFFRKAFLLQRGLQINCNKRGI